MDTSFKLPNEPGVYFFKNQRGEIIYIGKAKNLKKRVSSYFNSNHEDSPKTQILVKNIHSYDFIVVDNEVEALLLENKLIKKHSPKYNINLKDSKTFAYIKITEEYLPKITITRKVTKKGEYFGPFTDGRVRITLFNLAVSLFTLVTNKTYSSKSSLYYEIGKAPARDIKNIDREAYLENVEKAKRFLSGKDFDKIKKNIEEEMNDASKEKDFEKALEKKKQLEALYYVQEQQKVDRIESYDQDVLVHTIEEKIKRSIIMIFHIKKGVISSKEEFSFEYGEDVVLEFLKLYYSKKTPPKEILVNEELWEDENEKEQISKYLTKLRGSKVSLIKPLKGEKRRIVSLAEKNSKYFSKSFSILYDLEKKLSLPQFPSVIECFDISNLGREHKVGAMTRWVDGKPHKQGYRKFELKTLGDRQDDYKGMRETVYRRYRRILNNNERFPDLIIIDGGKGQLQAATDALDKLGKKGYSIIALAKKNEEIFVPDKSESIQLDKNSPVMLFIRSVRDSVHSYVLSYNRKKRDMSMKKEYKSFENNIDE